MLARKAGQRKLKQGDGKGRCVLRCGQPVRAPSWGPPAPGSGPLPVEGGRNNGRSSGRGEVGGEVEAARGCIQLLISAAQGGSDQENVPTFHGRCPSLLPPLQGPSCVTPQPHSIRQRAARAAGCVDCGLIFGGGLSPRARPAALSV